MSPLITPPPNTAPADEDLAEQALPGHGIPSQDPDPAAQVALESQDAPCEANSAQVGGGVVAGEATGAAIGVMVAGPGGAWWLEPRWVPLPAHWVVPPLGLPRTRRIRAALTQRPQRPCACTSTTAVAVVDRWC
jgi:hypothetical protein